MVEKRKEGRVDPHNRMPLHMTIILGMLLVLIRESP